MNTDYKRIEYSELQQRMARTYYEKNIEPIVKSQEKGGRNIYYECHIDFWEWGVLQEYETIRQMGFDQAADYVIEWLKTRDKTFYCTPRYVSMLNEMLTEIQ